jgi:hypothetical protein
LFFFFTVVFFFVVVDTGVIGVTVVAKLFDLMVFDCDEERIGGLVLIGESLIKESDNADEDE